MSSSGWHYTVNIRSNSISHFIHGYNTRMYISCCTSITLTRSTHLRTRIQINGHRHDCILRKETRKTLNYTNIPPIRFIGHVRQGVSKQSPFNFRQLNTHPASKEDGRKKAERIRLRKQQER